MVHWIPLNLILGTKIEMPLPSILDFYGLSILSRTSSNSSFPTLLRLVTTLGLLSIPHSILIKYYVKVVEHHTVP